MSADGWTKKTMIEWRAKSVFELATQVEKIDWMIPEWNLMKDRSATWMNEGLKN